MHERLVLGMTVCLQFAMEQPRRPWPEQVLPYGLAEILLVTPSRWTLTEASREVRLPARCSGRKIGSQVVVIVVRPYRVSPARWFSPIRERARHVACKTAARPTGVCKTMGHLR